MQVYTVAKGDTLWMIARKFGVSLEDVIKANPQIKDPNKINVGAKVNIPLPVENGKSVYTVQSGDTMWSIAQKFSISLESLLAANPEVTDADVITVGQRIFIPLRNLRQGNQLSYTVQPGDTLWKIAQRYGVTLEVLITANPQLADADMIFPGQTIYVPLPNSNPAAGVNNSALYFVKRGDTLFNIAQRYALNPDTLLIVNPQITDANRLNIGMQLYLPGFHYVRSGETLHAIANLYNVGLESLIAVNPQISDSDSLMIGDKITIPRQANGDMATYTVRQGDTLYKIAQKYNVPVEALLNANHEIISTDLIYPGQRLRIPGPHLVQMGQTMASIAAIYNISLDALRRANPNITNPEQLNPQTMLIIPAATAPSCRSERASGVDYVVQAGDTMSAIARMYRVPLSELIAYNPQINNPNEIKVGMIIHVPTGYVEYVCYVVQRGDTIHRIAGRYQISANAILRANPQIGSGNHIEPGMVLMIPIRAGRGEEVPEYRSEDQHIREERGREVTYPEIYVVQKGDTLYGLAKHFKTSVSQLRLANAAIKDSDTVYPGQQLIVLPADVVYEHRCLECPWLEQGRED